MLSQHFSFSLYGSYRKRCRLPCQTLQRCNGVWLTTPGREILTTKSAENTEKNRNGESYGEKQKAESRKLKLRQYGGNTEDGGPRTTNEERSTKDQGPSTKNQEHVSLVEAVCRLAEDENLRKRMGEAGRERVKTEFSVEKMLAGYDRVFRELAG